MNTGEQNRCKKAAAESAAALIDDGMVVGLGTGSTAAFFVEALGHRLAEDGLRITGIPSSHRTEDLAREWKIPLSSFAEHAQIDVTVDGTDEIERGTLCLIKGHGGALLREKIVAAASRRMIVIADETKVVDRLGLLVAVPVEVVRFGWQATARSLGKDWRQSVAAAWQRQHALRYRQRQLHHGLRLRSNRRSEGNRPSARSRGRSGRARPFSRLCERGDRRRAQRREDVSQIERLNFWEQSFFGEGLPTESRQQPESFPGPHPWGNSWSYELRLRISSRQWRRRAGKRRRARPRSLSECARRNTWRRIRRFLAGSSTTSAMRSGDARPLAAAL